MTPDSQTELSANVPSCREERPEVSNVDASKIPSNGNSTNPSPVVPPPQQIPKPAPTDLPNPKQTPFDKIGPTTELSLTKNKLAATGNRHATSSRHATGSLRAAGGPFDWLDDRFNTQQVGTELEIVAASELPTLVLNDEPQSDIGWKILTTAPAWLSSTIVHLVSLVLLGVLFFSSDVQRDFQVEMVFGQPSPDPIESLDVSVGTDETEQQEVTLPPDIPQVEVVPEPDVAPPEIEIVEETGVVEPSPRSAPSIGNALAGREPGNLEALAKRSGATGDTQGAVGLGLKWLKRNQRSGGNWSLRGPYKNGAGFENEVAATAMAMLAFQGAGNTHQRGTYKRAVRRGMNFLIKKMDSEGDFCRGIDSHQRLYSQAQATIVVCELYAMSQDKRLRPIAQAAVDYAIKIQDALGGWRYTPGNDTDTSVTGWFVMALKSAEMAGLEVPELVYENISRYLDLVTSYDGSRYAYRPGREFTEAMTAEALLCRQYLGWTREDGRLRDGVNYLLMHPVNYRDENCYYWYYATQVMHNMGGEEWQKWNQVMREKLPNKQTKTGRDGGSWVPTKDRWGVQAGRLYTTCLSLYMLEVYYRHLPVYGGVAEEPSRENALE